MDWDPVTVGPFGYTEGAQSVPSKYRPNQSGWIHAFMYTLIHSYCHVID